MGIIISIFLRELVVGKTVVSGFVLGLPCGSNSKESACYVEEHGSVPGSGRSSGEENGNPCQYSFLENSMDREAWWATICGIEKSQT